MQEFLSSSWGMIIIWGLLFVAMYFFLIRPGQKKRKAEQEMRSNIEVGDEVITIGGIVGRIVAVKEEEEAYIIETGSDRVKMKFKTWSISSVVKPEDKQPKAEAKTEEKKGFFSKFKKKQDEQ